MLTPAARRRRRKSIGASDIPILMGLSRYKTPADLYAEKVDGVVSPDSPAAEWGHRHEPAIAKWVAQRLGAKVRVVRGSMVNGVYSCTPDRRIDGYGYLEIKTRSSDLGWGPEDTGVIPDDVMAQVQWSMSVAEEPYWWVAVLLGGNDARLYRILADRDAQDRLQRVARDFWLDHVLPRVPPPGYELRGMTPIVPAERPLSVGDDILCEELARGYVRAKAAAEQAEAQRSMARWSLELALAGLGGAVRGTWGTVRLTEVASRSKVDWEKVARRLAVSGPVFDNAIRECTVAGNPYRRLEVRLQERKPADVAQIIEQDVKEAIHRYSLEERHAMLLGTFPDPVDIR